MVYTITKKGRALEGEITLPASKSISNRLLIIRALCDDDFRINNLSAAEDTKVLDQLLNSNNNELNAGSGGTTLRFLTAYLAIKEGAWILTGTEQMKKRPIAVLVKALKELGADIEYMEAEGYPPIKIKGTQLTGSEINIDGSVSSQYISALLMIAPLLPNGIKLNIEGKVTSRSYIRMTLKIMVHYGITCSWRGNTITIENGEYKACDYTVEPDWSAASYWYAMAALSEKTDIILKNLTEESLQGDRVVAQIFSHFGVRTEYTDNGVRLSEKKDTVQEFGFDFSDCPDLAQTVLVVSAALNIPAIYSGLKSLEIKETDRIMALRNEMKKLGVIVEEAGGGNLKVYLDEQSPLIPESKLSKESLASDIVIQTYADHRMAMAFAPLTIKLGEIRVSDPEIVNKSYPGFWESLKDAGCEIVEEGS